MKPRNETLNALKAGAVYFGLVFVAGFVLGTIRTLVISPALGEVSAVLVELPFMLVVSWIACCWIVNLLLVQKNPIARITMGISALLMLLVAEAMLSIGFAGLSLQEHFALYLKLAAQLGLLGQFAFAVFPLIQLKFPTGQDRFGIMQ